MPGVHMAAPVTVPHVEPIGPPTGVQLEPVQQTLGAGAGWGVHVRPGAHAPVVSQKQPWVPTMHVDFAPMLPPAEPEDPEDPELLPEPDSPPELLADPPEASSPKPKVLEPPPEPLPPPDESPDDEEVPPQAHSVRISDSGPTMTTQLRPEVRIVMTSPPRPVGPSGRARIPPKEDKYLVARKSGTAPADPISEPHVGPGVFITADAGGSNSYRSHVWKYELQRIADRFGLVIHVCHFPPGTSKCNKVEHGLKKKAQTAAGKSSARHR